MTSSPASVRWSIDEVGLPVHDLGAARAFYEEVVGLGGAGETGDGVVRLSNGRQSLALYEPRPEFAAGRGAVHNPFMGKYISLAVEDRDGAAAALARRGVAVTEQPAPATEGASLLFCWDPSFNLVAFAQAAPGAAAAAWDDGGGWAIHHVNLHAHDVRATVAFFVEVAGMAEGTWLAPPDMGDFSIDRRELALLTAGRDYRGLHLIRPDPGFALRNGFAHNPSIGGHPAFRVPDIQAVMRRLAAAGILYSDARVYAMRGYHQVYVYDPSFNLIEINQQVG